MSSGLPAITRGMHGNRESTQIEQSQLKSAPDVTSKPRLTRRFASEQCLKTGWHHASAYANESNNCSPNVAGRAFFTARGDGGADFVDSLIANGGWRARD